MSASFLNMSLDSPEVAVLVEQAAGVVVATANKVKITEAMRLVGFSDDMATNMTLYQRVRRKSRHLALVDTKKKENAPPPDRNSQARMSPAASPLTQSEASANNRQENPPVLHRNAAGDEASQGTGNSSHAPSTPSRKAADKVPVKKKRRATREVRREEAEICKAQKKKSLALKAATRLIAANNKKPRNEREAVADIVKRTNQKFGSNITAKTAARYVRNGLVGLSPLKRGPDGELSKPVFS